jgi:hypothetical protein
MGKGLKKLFISLLAVVMLSGCSFYSINKSKYGIFDMTAMYGNQLYQGGDRCSFDLNKRSYGKDDFYGVDIIYSLNGTDFDIDRSNGIRVVINGSGGFYIKQRKYHICNKYDGSISMSGSTVTGATGPSTTMFIYGLLTPPQLLRLVNADSIKLIFVSPVIEGGPADTKEFDFTRDNIDNIRRFYNDYVKSAQEAKL